MATKKRAVLMRFQPESYDKLKVLSAMNRRSVTNQVEILVDQFIRSYEKENGAVPMIDNSVSLNESINNGNINNTVMIHS